MIIRPWFLFIQQDRLRGHAGREGKLCKRIKLTKIGLFPLMLFWRTVSTCFHFSGIFFQLSVSTNSSQRLPDRNVSVTLKLDGKKH